MQRQFMCASFVIILFVLLVATACDHLPNETIRANTKTSLDSALDSVEILFLSPKARKIIERVRPAIFNNTDEKIRVKGFRLISSVILSKGETNQQELDSAARLAKHASQLAVQAGDSIQWAFCTIQVFRYENIIRENGFVRQTIGPKTILHTALRIIEESNLTDALSFGYRTLARSLLIDREAALDVLNYELLALQYNDSSRYPVLRARICADLGTSYLGSFNQLDIAESYFLRAAEIFKRTDDILNYARLINNLASITADASKSIQYSHQLLNVLRSGEFPVEESRMNFMFALRLQSMKFYDSALFYLQRSIQKLPGSSGDNQEEILYRQACMARSYAGVGQLLQAKKLTLLLEKLQGEFFFTYNAIPELKTRVTIYEALKDFKKLTETQQRLIELQSSMFSKGILSEAGKIENAYKLKLKNKGVKELQVATQLRNAVAVRERSKRLLLTGIALIAVLTLLLIGFLFARKKRLSLSLTHQKGIIERQKIALERSLNQLQRVQAHILHSEKTAMLGHFTAGVAHELNNPLNFISGGISVFEELAEVDEKNSPEDFQALRAIRNGIDHAMNIVNTLRVFLNPRSEIEGDSFTNIAECMRACLLVLKSKIRSENVNIVCNAPDYAVVGHSGQLCQVFINLVDNAIYAVRNLPAERKNIEFLARRVGSHVLIDVRDSGTGIPDSIRSNLCQPFFTTKPAGQGIGLGLFICHTILQGIGGTIEFNNNAEQGATVTVQLAQFN